MYAKQYRMDPSLVHDHFARDYSLMRRRKDGTVKPINTINGGRLEAMFDNERIDAAAIVWCMEYGNWPKYPLAILDGDPHNLALDNIWPVKGKALRYRETERDGKFYHPLTDASFRLPSDCRANWVVWARLHYQRGLGSVLDEESRERKTREAVPEKSAGLLDYERRQAARNAQLQARLGVPKVKRPPRPDVVDGKVWIWYLNEWQLLAEPVHVSDDYRVRHAAYAKGAVRSEYQELHGETWYLDAAGEPVLRD